MEDKDQSPVQHFSDIHVSGESRVHVGNAYIRNEATTAVVTIPYAEQSTQAPSST